MIHGLIEIAGESSRGPVWCVFSPWEGYTLRFNWKSHVQASYKMPAHSMIGSSLAHYEITSHLGTAG